jgi:hypothetical protein
LLVERIETREDLITSLMAIGRESGGTCRDVDKVFFGVHEKTQWRVVVGRDP